MSPRDEQPTISPDPPPAGTRMNGRDGPAPASTPTTDGPEPAGAPPTMSPDPVCPESFHDCAGTCVSNLSPDTCGIACSACTGIEGGQPTCDGTRCGVACPTGQKPCLSRCIPENEPCDDNCPAGKNLCNAVCVEPTSLTACGSSCATCPSSPNGVASCDGDKCDLTCNPGFHRCEDMCLDDSKPTSCGDSCSPCPVPDGGEATCEAGKCGARCPSGKKLCAGACIANNQACNGVCPAGQRDCSGTCVREDDVNFCGPTCSPCGKRDNATVKCEGGRCVFSCRAGFHDCNGVCKDNRSVESCGGRCERCPTPANGTASCDGSTCSFSCNPGSYRCGNACLPRNQPCNGACQNRLKLCGGTCVEGNCCPGDSCGPCKSCQNNRCQPTADGQPGPGCSGTCRECENGTCRDRPNAKVCGNACVSASTCCTNNVPGRCPDCSNCQGNGQCSAPQGISCGGGRCVPFGQCCVSCGTCQRCTANGLGCMADNGASCTSGGQPGTCNGTSCALVKRGNNQPCPAGGSQCQSGNCSGGLCCPGGQNNCGGCQPNSPNACGASCRVCPVPANGRATCSGNGTCGFECNPPFVKEGNGCAQPCGDENEVCCGGNRCNAGNLACNRTGRCVRCGGGNADPICCNRKCNNPDNYCDDRDSNPVNHLCMLKGGDGVICNAAKECLSNVCTNGVCGRPGGNGGPFDECRANSDCRSNHCGACSDGFSSCNLQDVGKDCANGSVCQLFCFGG
jgi:hypothetical protein